MDEEYVRFIELFQSLNWNNIHSILENRCASKNCDSMTQMTTMNRFEKMTETCDRVRMGIEILDYIAGIEDIFVSQELTFIMQNTKEKNHNHLISIKDNQDVLYIQMKTLDEMFLKL